MPTRRAGLLTAALAVLALGVAPPISSSAPAAIGFFPPSETPSSVQTTANDRSAVELGLRVRFVTAGQVTGVRFYKGGALNRGPHAVSVWSATGQRLRTASSTGESASGWQLVPVQPVSVARGQELVVSYLASNGAYSATPEYFVSGVVRGQLGVAAGAGVFRYGSGGGFPDRVYRNMNYWVDVQFTPGPAQSPRATPTPSSSSSTAPTPTPTRTPSPTPTPSRTTATPTPSNTAPASPSPTPTSPAARFPDASSTGVPDGTTLTPFEGPCEIAVAGTHIKARSVNCTVIVRAPDVRISASRVTGAVLTEGQGSVTIEDSEIDSGTWVGPTIGYSRVVVRRSDIRGGQHSVLCSSRCTIEQSWLHAQSLPPKEARHNNGFLSNGGNDVVVRKNRIACTPKANSVGGGCSGDLSIFGDFGPNSNFVIDGNLFEANSDGIPYCLYAGHDPGKQFGSNPQNITITNNVFQRGPNRKCGIYGPVTSYLPGNGNRFEGNVWDDGSPIQP